MLRLIRFYSTTPAKNLLYVGPINRLVSRMKGFSLGTAIATTVACPLLLHYAPSEQFTMYAKAGLLSSGKLAIN